MAVQQDVASRSAEERVARAGIACVTFQRIERLKRLVAAIREFTETPYELVVADDGSDDGSADWCRDAGLRVVTGDNRGVCWNKNRGLYALHLLGCDPLILIEDDIYPVEYGWETTWVEAARRFDHVAYAHPKIAGQVVSGDGSAERPYVNTKATAQCTAISAKALKAVGFLDTRFVGYGVGHAEWTTRVKRAGMGYENVTLEDGTTAKGNLYVKGGLQAEDAPSFRDNAQVRANRELFAAIKREPIYRNAWSEDAERETLMREMEAAGLDGEAGLDREPELPAGEVKTITRGAKWGTADVFAMLAMQPLSGGFVPWTSFSLRPAALQTLLNELDLSRPALTVELGSGASTLLVGRLLKQRDWGGRLLSVESNAGWAEYISGLVEGEGLGVYVDIVHAPMTALEAGRLPAGSAAFPLPSSWYDGGVIATALEGRPIDVLFVDGPPGSKSLSRYPAVPLLADHLAADAVIMLDDANRPSEGESARRWSGQLGIEFTVYERMSLAVGRRGSGFTPLGG